MPMTTRADGRFWLTLRRRGGGWNSIRTAMPSGYEQRLDPVNSFKAELHDGARYLAEPYQLGHAFPHECAGHRAPSAPIGLGPLPGKEGDDLAGVGPGALGMGLSDRGIALFPLLRDAVAVR
jgi:hypothetical protein